MPGIIDQLDKWKPSDNHLSRDLRQEQVDTLRKKIGDELYQYLEELENVRNQNIRD